MFSGNFFFLLQWKSLSTGEVREARFDWQELTKTPRQPSSSTAVVGKAGFKDQRLNETWSWWATAAEDHRRFHTCQEPNSDVPLGTCLWKLGGWSIFLLRPQTWHWRQETLTNLYDVTRSHVPFACHWWFVTCNGYFYLCPDTAQYFIQIHVLILIST